MASSKEYADYIFEQLSELGVEHRRMMGEYVLYYGGKVVGGIYDDRLLVKNVPEAKRLMPDAPVELPYEGAKEMLLVERTDDRDFLNLLIPATADGLPAPKIRKNKAENGK